MRTIALVVFPGFQVLDLAAAAAFELANKETGKSVYAVEVLSEQGGPVPSSSGISVDSRPFGTGAANTVIMGGALDISQSTPQLCQYLRAQLTTGRRIASICTGAFNLAEAGLLDGRRATTHWAYARELQAKFPSVKVEEDRIFIKDGKVWTSAGMTAGLDLMLALIEEDLGFELSRAVARKMVLYHRRGGGQSQFSALLELQPQSGRIQKTLTHAKANLHKPLSVEDLAAVAHLSPRQFSRAFKTETGRSPARAIEHMRVEAARDLIFSSDHPLTAVAARTGFHDLERMRRAFLRAYGQPPQGIRRAAIAERVT